MNSITIRALLPFLLIVLFACGDDPEPGISKNTWILKPEGHSTGTYRKKTITLSTQTYQVVEVISEDNPGGGNVGINSTLKLYFATIGPPPSGTYQITSVDKLSGHPDQVAITLYTFGDPSTGLIGTYWFTPENTDQTISYTFADGKLGASFKDIAVSQTGTGVSTGIISANISQ